MYPGRVGPAPTPTVQDLDVFHPAAHEIAAAGEEDVFHFSVGAQGRHVVETSGSTDVVIVLFGPDNQNLKIAEDDDGGEGRNARIAADLGAGRVLRRRPPRQADGARRLPDHGAARSDRLRACC